MRRTGPIKISYRLTRKAPVRSAAKKYRCCNKINKQQMQKARTEIASARHDLINAQVAAETASKQVEAKAPAAEAAVKQAQPVDNGPEVTLWDASEVIEQALSNLEAQMEKWKSFEFKMPYIDADKLVASSGPDALTGGVADDSLVEKPVQLFEGAVNELSKVGSSLFLTSLSKGFTIAEENEATTEAAKKLLSDFRRGTGPKRYKFGPNSVEVKELLAYGYYQELNHYLLDEVYKIYQMRGTKIPENDTKIFKETYHFKAFKNFPASELLVTVSDLINPKGVISVADVIGSFTFPIEVSIKNGSLWVKAVNSMSLESFTGANILQHKLKLSPQTGPFSKKIHEFCWQIPIPVEMREE